ncbi:hypothetical protein VFPPC_12774 [Pochonia chlamydosporia 170]|uniref:Uncharacterized protein n=1 Tax=Pochonia chlamydosporia 170 TaxID=1380566 RepID=A0A179G505_METCM|nr:hypothetical protein VFPPC_12774 [Pochonia chlamydosporia 170]OAQ72433.1 hypothetical protein VFPPC_12774 [Pochonia chlamydosporia 170]
MPFDSSRSAKLPQRPNSKTAEHGTKPAKCKSVTNKQGQTSDSTVIDLSSLTLMDTHPYSSSSRHEDAGDWVVVQTDSAPPSNYSDDIHSYGPGQELSATNVQLFDTLNNCPPSVCEAAENGEGRRCHRRCPKCRGGSVKTHVSTATRNSYLVENARHLDPWAPVSTDFYESDVFAVGAWAMEGDAETTTYHYATTF